MADFRNIYSNILEAKLQPLNQQWDQARQGLEQQYQQLNQKYNSPEARQAFEQRVNDQINNTFTSFISNAVNEPFVKSFYDRSRAAQQTLQDVVAGKYPPGSRVSYTDPERGTEVGIRLSGPGIEGKPYPEDIFLAQQRLNYFNQLLTNPNTGKPWEFNPADMNSVPQWVLDNAFRSLGDTTGLGQSTTWEGHSDPVKRKQLALQQLGQGLYNQISSTIGEQVGRAEQAELDAFTRQQNRTNMGFQEQIDAQARTLGPQIQTQLNEMFQRSQSEGVPLNDQDILGAFDLAPKTPVSNFLTGNISAQQLQAAQTPAQPATQPATQQTQQAQPVTQPEALLSQAQPVAQPAAQAVTQQTQPVAQPATPAESPFLTGTAPVAPAATTAMTAPVTAATPVTTTTAAPATAAPATAAPMATTLGTPMATPTSMDIAAQPISAGIGGQQAMPQTFLTGTAAQPTGLRPESLPALRGTATGQSAVDPTLRPYLELGLRGAEQLFLQQAPSLYPGQMFVSPSQQTLDALAQTEQIARAQPSALQAAQESYMAGLGGLGFTAGGGFLGSNPFQQRAIEAATRPIMQQFEQTTLPTIAGQFSAAGRYGSGAMGRITGQAQEASSRALGDVAANIAYTDYARERGLQDAAIRNQLQASTLAPQIYGQQFLPAQQLAQVGAAREAIAAQPLQEAITRYQYQQQLPYQQLGGFLSSIYGTPLAGSQYQTPAQAQTNRAGSALGLAATGAGIGNLIGGTTGAGYGAVLGGLAGLLG